MNVYKSHIPCKIEKQNSVRSASPLLGLPFPEPSAGLSSDGKAKLCCFEVGINGAGVRTRSVSGCPRSACYLVGCRGLSP